MTNDPLAEELKDISYDDLHGFLEKSPRFIKIYNSFSESKEIEEIHRSVGEEYNCNANIRLYWYTDRGIYLIYHLGAFYHMSFLPAPNVMDIDLSILESI